MRVKIAAILAFILLFSAGPAQADSRLDDATAAFKLSHLYVASDVKLSTDQKAQLQNRLNGSDHIFIAMFSANSAASNESQQLADQLVQRLANPAIVTVAVGNTVAASTSSVLPADVAQQLIVRSNSIGTSPQETLGIFVTSVHAYQLAHPEAIGQAEQSSPGISWGAFWIGVIAVALGGVIFLHVRSKRFRLRMMPKPIRKLIIAIDDQSNDIDNPATRKILLEITNNTYKLFNRRSKDQYIDDTRVAIMLNRILEATQVYARIERAPYEYEHGVESLQNSCKSFEASNDWLKDSVRKANRGEVIKLDGNSDLLNGTIF